MAATDKKLTIKNHQAKHEEDAVEPPELEEEEPEDEEEEGAEPEEEEEPREETEEEPEEEEEKPVKRSGGAETAEEKRARRAQERKDRRGAAKEARMRDKMTIAKLTESDRTKNAIIAELQNSQTQITEHLVGQTVTGIDKDIQAQQQNIASARNLLANARNKADTAAELRAEDLLYESRQELDRLQQQKRAINAELARQPAAGQKPAAPQKPVKDPAQVRAANTWMNKHKFSTWTQTEQNFAKTEDVALRRENRFDPGSEEFYNELTRRIGAVLPGKVGLIKTERERPKGPGGNSSGGGGAKRSAEGDLSKGIPADTIAAWKKAGFWNDGNIEQKKRMRNSFYTTAAQAKR